MTPLNFVYWLQGCLETNPGLELSARQVEVIQDHIKLILTKVTPDRQTVEDEFDTEAFLKQFDKIKKEELSDVLCKAPSSNKRGIKIC